MPQASEHYDVSILFCVKAASEPWGAGTGVHLKIVGFIKDENCILPADLAQAHSVLGIYEVIVGHEHNVCCAGHLLGQQVWAGPRQLPQLHQVLNVQRFTIHIWVTGAEPLDFIAPAQHMSSR